MKHPMLTIAERAARKAGDMIMRKLGDIDKLKITQKGFNDFVTEVDLHAEDIIIDLLQQTYPTHRFLSEERGYSGDRHSDDIWIIDPLDGTTNFIHAVPHFCVSIALQQNNQLTQALIYDPLKQELFTASKGRGALLNNQKMRVSQQKKLQGALLGIGLSHRIQENTDKTTDQILRLLSLKVAGIRRSGSAALDLAYVACGRFDGFLEYGLQPWDMAAGILLIQESGGMSCAPDLKSDMMESGCIVAANPHLLTTLHAELERH